MTEQASRRWIAGAAVLGTALRLAHVLASMLLGAAALARANFLLFVALGAAWFADFVRTHPQQQDALGYLAELRAMPPAGGVP